MGTGWMRLQDKRTKRIAVFALLSAFAILCGYLETLLPLSFGIPGVKLGLANVVSLLILCGKRAQGRIWEAVLVLFVRVTVVGLLFGNLYSILYGLAGGLFSVAVMAAASGFSFLGVPGVSILGGIAHNLGQLSVAMLVVDQLKLTFYAPVLLLSGTITGALLGVLAAALLHRLAETPYMRQFFSNPPPDPGAKDDGLGVRADDGNK